MGDSKNYSTLKRYVKEAFEYLIYSLKSYLKLLGSMLLNVYALFTILYSVWPSERIDKSLRSISYTDIANHYPLACPGFFYAFVSSNQIAQNASHVWPYRWAYNWILTYEQ